MENCVFLVSTSADGNNPEIFAWGIPVHLLDQGISGRSTLVIHPDGSLSPRYYTPKDIRDEICEDIIKHSVPFREACRRKRYVSERFKYIKIIRVSRAIQLINRLPLDRHPNEKKLIFYRTASRSFENRIYFLRSQREGHAGIHKGETK